MSPTHVFAFSTLALLAGCSSRTAEDISASSAAVSTQLTFHEIFEAAGTFVPGDVGSCPLNAYGNTQANWLTSTSSGTESEFTWNDDLALGNVATPVSGQFGIAIDVGAAGPWVVNESNLIYASFYDDGVAVYGQIGGRARDVGVSNDGLSVYVVGVNDLLLAGRPVDAQVYRWTGGGGANPWVPVTGVLGRRVDAANDGSAWVVNQAGAVLHVTGTPAAPVVTQIAPANTAEDITVASDGTVFIVYSSGWDAEIVDTPFDEPIAVYDPNANVFDVIPGAMGVRVSAASSTSLTVYNSEGQVWTSADGIKVTPPIW